MFAPMGKPLIWTPMTCIHTGAGLKPTLLQFSCSVVSDFLRPHESQHTRPPCPPPTPGVYPNWCPLSWWCHPAISSSVIPFSSCPQSFPASGSFPVSQLFAWGGQSIGVSASVSVLPMNTQDWSPLGWLVGSPCSPRDSQESSPTPQFKSINSSVFFTVQLSYPYVTTGKTIALTRQTFVGKVMSLLFNMLSRLAITFLPRSKESFNFVAAITICSDFGAPQNKVWHCFHCFPIYLLWSDGTRCHDLSFLNVEL